MAHQTGSNRAEKAETGITSVTTLLPLTQTTTTASGCTSKFGFSIISGQSCASVAITHPFAASSTPAASWSELENQSFPENIKRGSLSITLTNSFGEQHYYRLENGVYVQKNTHAEALQPIVTTSLADTPAKVESLPAYSSPLAVILEVWATKPNYITFKTYGINAIANRARVGLYDALEGNSNPAIYYVNTYNASLRILMNINSSSIDSRNNYKCEKPGNIFWVGPITAYDHWEENIANPTEITKFYNDYIALNGEFSSPKLAFTVTCTDNKSGFISTDTAYVELKKF